MTSPNQNIDLKLYEDNLPLLKAGLLAKDKLAADDGSLTRREKTELRRQATEGDRAFERMIDRINWLAKKIVRQEMEKPRTFHVILNEEDLMQAAYEGVFKMCRNMDLSKMSSAVNYLMSWIRTSVEREAGKDEAEFGVSASKLRLYKKISAIRAKMEKETDRKVTDEELLEYIHSGAADVKTKYGHKAESKAKRGGVMENQKITLEQIRGQRELTEDFSMHFPVTDPAVIDRDVQDVDISNDVIAPDNKSFWMEFMRTRHIRESQWSDISLALQLYDTDRKGDYARGELTRATRIGEDFKVFIQSDHAAMAAFTRSWMSDHGDGPWTRLMAVPALPDEILFENSNPKDWHRNYKHLKFND